MRMSCNGCRVLRKGCGEGCSIRPCLQWIKTPEAQANATVFLAKFYGRAGLINLINAGPDHFRPGIFRSLLYEACGRMVNPIYGSVGLLWSGQWHMCQAAVETVLRGAPVVQIPSEVASATSTSPLKAYDIRHITRDRANAADRLKVAWSNRTRFKPASSSSSKPKAKPNSPSQGQEQQLEPATDGEQDRASSHEESAGSHENVEEEMMVEEAHREVEALVVVALEDTEVEAGMSHVSQAEHSVVPVGQAGEEVGEEGAGLELTLSIPGGARRETGACVSGGALRPDWLEQGVERHRGSA